MLDNYTRAVFFVFICALGIIFLMGLFVGYWIF
nr:MAG TPA: chitin synthase regulator [Caudoviricetes sp.]